MMNCTNVVKAVLFVTLCFLVSGCMPKGKTYEERQEELGKCKFTLFKLEKKYNPGLKEDLVFDVSNTRNIHCCLTSDADIKTLIPTFKVGAGRVLLNGVEQFSGMTPVDFSKKVTYTLEYDARDKFEVSVYIIPYTGLPVIEIQTANNASITSKEIWLHAHIKINGMGQFEDLEDSIQLKGRGNATWSFPKKAFNVKFPKKKSVLNMKKHKRWTFLANYRDRTLLRNDVTFMMGHLADNLEWTPHAQFAEVVFNGKYEGNFLITEQIRVDENRVPIDEMTDLDVEGDNLTGGYLLEYDSYFDEVNKFKSTVNRWPVNLKNPDEDVCQPVQFEYIQKFHNEFEVLLQEKRFDELFANYMDMKSFIDYYIVQTISNNGEMIKAYSVYCYKKRNGKLYAGPLWDFDYSTYNKPTGGRNLTALWYNYLFKSPVFTAALKQRWNVLKPIIESRIYDYIDDKVSYLQKSEVANWAVYPIRKNITPNGDEEMTFEEAINRMKTTLKERFEYLDTVINEL